MMQRFANSRYELLQMSAFRSLFAAIVSCCVISTAAAQSPPVPSTMAPLGGTSAPVTASGVYNFNSSALLHWRKAVANVRSGQGRGRLVILGESTSMGQGSGSGGTGNLNGAYPYAWPQQMASMLNTMLSSAANTQPVSANAIMCDQNVSAAAVGYAAYDTRVTLGSSWSTSNGGNCAGGNTFIFTCCAVNNLTFAPVAAFDTLTLYYYTQTPVGTATINVDGGASLGTITFGPATPDTIATATYSVANATHTINIVPTGGSFQLAGIVTSLSTKPAIDVIQAATSGATIAYFTANTYATQGLRLEATLAPDLTIIAETGNDSINQTPVAAYTASMQAVITNAKLSGDVILIAGPPNNAGFTFAPYVAALRSLAASNNVPLLDLTTRWTSWAVTNPVMPYFDQYHPGKLGYSDIALAVAELLAAP